MPSPHTSFRDRIRGRQQVLGYWCVLDAPVATERIARLGYDYVAIDMQHGLVGYAGMVNSLTAIDASQAAVGVIRVGENDPAPIGRALDAGAVGVIVPLVDTAGDAARAVEAARYGLGRRSYGPMRSGLRIGPTPADADAAVAVIVMIETAAGLDNVEEIARVDGVDALYVGPSDLRLAIGGATSSDRSVDDEFEAAVRRVAAAAEAAGIGAGIHTPAGDVAARRLAEGFTFASVASDLVHLENVAGVHLVAARNGAVDGG